MLVLQEYQFEFPNPFPEELVDVRDFLASSDRLLYMAEFFSECIKQIRVRLGPTDKDLESYLLYLTPTTKKCVLDNSFGINVASFEFQGEIPMKLSDYLKFLFLYFECFSFEEIDNLKQRGDLKFAVSDEDMEFITQYMPKARSITIEATKVMTDKTMEYISERCKEIQVIKIPGVGGKFTDACCVALGQLKRLTSVMITSAENITDDGILALSSAKLEWLTLDNDNITNIGLGKLPSTLRNMESHSKNFTPDGVIALLKNVKGMTNLALPNAILTDECVIEVFRNCPFIETLDIRSSVVTDKCLNTIPIPDSFKKLIISKQNILSATSTFEICYE